jgi:hypothetical protein
MVHVLFSCSQQSVNAVVHTLCMNDPVWLAVERELERRRAKHQTPNSWAALGRSIGASDQRVQNWKSRGIPSRQHVTIAAALGWSVDQLLGNPTTPATTAPNSAEETAPQYNTGSLRPEHRQLLADIAILLPARQSAILDMIHQEAEAARALADHVNKRRATTIAADSSPKASGRLVIRYGDGNPMQGALPLTNVADPFTATPDEREKKLYDQFAKSRERHPK